MKQGTPSGFAADRDFSAHCFDEFLRDGQAESGAAKTSGPGTVRLAEGLQQPFVAVGWVADVGGQIVKALPEDTMVSDAATKVSDAWQILDLVRPLGN